MATASMMAHAQLPLIGLALGFLAVHYLVAPLGVWLALAVGLASASAGADLLVPSACGSVMRSLYFGFA